MDAYYRIIKPGIVYGNAWHMLGGMLIAASTVMAHANENSILSAIGALAGTMLIIASACVSNNIIDRDIDRRMKRTKKRPSVTGSVTTQRALIYASTLFLAGLITLILFSNYITVLLGVSAYVVYVFIYSYSKRYTVHSTLIGTVPGAIPAAAGYTALVGVIDLTAWLIFLVIVAWQLPHFYAISVFRKSEYAAAKLPVLACVAKPRTVRSIIMACLLGFVACVGLFAIYTLSMPAGVVYFTAAVIWLIYSIPRRSDDYAKWGRKVFGGSMYLSLCFVGVAAIDFASKTLM